MHKAMDAAREAGTKVAFTLSICSSSSGIATTSGSCSESAGSTSYSPTKRRSWVSAGDESAEEAALAVAAEVTTLSSLEARKALSRFPMGRASFVPAEPIDALVDTTGAGDLFAAGYLAGEARGLGLERSLKLGAICAAEVIQHYGARPEADLKALARNLIA